MIIPVVKTYPSEAGSYSVNNGLQVLGGYGFCSDFILQQYYRDIRISAIYEGTTGIQALDLLGRKILMSGGEIMKPFCKDIHKFCEAEKDNPLTAKLSELNNQWGKLTGDIGSLAMANADEVGAASVDYLMFSGYVSLAYFWALAATKAQTAIDAGNGDTDFYKAKIQTANTTPFSGSDELSLCSSIIIFSAGLCSCSCSRLH